MRAALQVINQMVSDGVIGKYAIGGAIGATFYLEPVATFDLDIFISFVEMSAGPLVSLEPIYSYLTQRGYKPEREHLMIDGWPVQFLPADEALHAEALAAAISVDYGDIRTWVITAEFLMAIALKTGRSKDLVRVGQFVEEGAFEMDKLNAILGRHQLLPKWESFRQKYLKADE